MGLDWDEDPIVPAPPGAPSETYVPDPEEDQDAMRETTVRVFGHVWVRQTIANLARIARWPSITALKGAFTGLPAFVVSPGPSLDRNVAELRRAHGRGIIIAGTHALLPLQAAGIVPDFAVAVDAQDLTSHFAGYRWDPLTTLVLDAAAHTSAVTQPAKRFLFWPGCARANAWAFSAFDSETQTLPSGGSVSCVQLSLAAYWGCNPIVLVGQDLAYPEGRIYAGSDERVDTEAGTYQARTTMTSPSRPIAMPTLPGYHGGTVHTSYEYRTLHRWYAENVPRMAADGHTIVNATEGGAHIPGAVQTSLREAIDAHCYALAFPSRKVQQAVDALDRPARLAAMAERVELIRGHLEASITMADYCTSLAIQEDLGKLPEAKRVLGEIALPFLEDMARNLQMERWKEVREGIERVRELHEPGNRPDKIEADKWMFLLYRSTAAMLRPLFEAVNLEAAA